MKRGGVINHIDRSGSRYQKGWLEVRLGLPRDSTEAEVRRARQIYEIHYAGSLPQSLDELEVAWARFNWNAAVR